MRGPFRLVGVAVGAMAVERSRKFGRQFAAPFLAGGVDVGSDLLAHPMQLRTGVGLKLAPKLLGDAREFQAAFLERGTADFIEGRSFARGDAAKHFAERKSSGFSNFVQAQTRFVGE